ncbi:class II fumarate hydratase [Streptomyces clavuligerus]|uniref:Fumarate hydratase class II n=1 Tax=Streptomyces clavuligerus TaxID=1901 RepID=B5GTU1_STRCL|nr:class II fumarate hydratase [Streptomyces clavuligerus]ANW18356.1 aspartate ammonia-lyase [Streptomyces clavuligerus]AXU12913.1 class II fumarate hydratase [Streptomyces clavuligerus]EDY49737.1 fumarate hydratase class II [Streptomyces clavuligerus]EFG09020.1 fumarate hydratase [Streptomyces clavuligerus]MBY6302838.1 class II fumarate hydratase [Streptomyces clavuligerus]
MSETGDRPHHGTRGTDGTGTTGATGGTGTTGGTGSTGAAGGAPATRVEHDSMGEVRVPAHAKWRAQTQRAVENFPLSGQRLERAHIAALARIKGAAARVNAELGVIDRETADAIAAAADEVAEGRWDEHFPVDVFQTGSGTSSNMNANEVLATLASERLGRPVHPNDQVNASQSSNDVFPSSIHIAATAAVTGDLIPALEHLSAALERKSIEFADVVKAGRTHLMDATPVTLGQEFGGYAAQVRHGVERLEAALPRLAELPLGGTAVGTGINTPPGFSAAVIAEVARATGLPLTEARDHFEAQGARDALVETSGQLRVVAVSLTKICNDLRWMASGPRTGLAEIHLPDLQPGSSIMPGKVNPVVPEAVLMVAAQVTGNDTTVAVAGAAGNFELNVMLPVMAKNVLESVRLLANAARLLADRTVDGIRADAERAREYAESSPSVVTPLNRYIGYEEAARIAKRALAGRVTIREAVLESEAVRRRIADGELTREELEEALDVLRMTRP